MNSHFLSPMTSLACHNKPPFMAPSRSPRGLTLVEMLVAMALTLLLMGAVAQIFGILGQGVNGSRSVAELSARMRSTAHRLQQDLAGMTVNPQPPVRADGDTGYLEIIEGPESDQATYLSGTRFDKASGTVVNGKWVGTSQPYQGVVGSDDRLVGDVDDVLLFTTRSTGDLFTGRADTRNTNIEGGSLKSPLAEVIWFCRPTANTVDPRTYTLHRRQRLVTAQPGAPPFLDTSAAVPQNSFGGPPNTIPFSDWTTIYGLTDVSCRREGTLAIPNSLGDLSLRENRFLHNGQRLAEFPHPFYAATYDASNHTFDNNPARFGEDIILTNVIAFDVRVWDPNAPMKGLPAVLNTGNNANPTQLAVTPGDPLYGDPAAVTPPVVSGYRVGSYVDLGWAGGPAAVNVGAPFPASGSAFQGRGVNSANASRHTFTYPTYDTWSSAYETNGVDDDADALIDNGTNGLDDNANGVIDEASEQETSPPYPTALQGIQIRLRCYEPSSRQVRQITILKSF
jgi:prepilin-type N-terminal cleavage/methylation domain-containing protein